MIRGRVIGILGGPCAGATTVCAAALEAILVFATSAVTATVGVGGRPSVVSIGGDAARVGPCTGLVVTNTAMPKRVTATAAIPNMIPFVEDRRIVEPFVGPSWVTHGFSVAANAASGTSEPREGGSCPDPEAPPEESRTMRSMSARLAGGTSDSSATATSAMLWYLRARSFSRHRRMTASSSCGSSGFRSRRSSGASAAIAERSPPTVTAKGRQPREQLVEHHADGPDVGSKIDALRASNLLGRHIRRRTEDRGRVGDARVAGGVPPR